MYSAVLMLALTAGSETADFGRNRCNSGAASCSSSCSRVVSCSSSCHTRQRLFGNHGHRCSSSSSCSTSYGCASSCSSRGGLFHRNNRCCGTVVTCSTGVACSGGGACSGTVAPPIPEKKPLPKGEELKKPKGSVQSSAPATIVVTLPAGARLLVDGTATTSVAERRTLITPELEVGATYVYTMQAEIVRDGRTVVQTQDVNVRGGETTTVQFQFSNQGVASR